MSQKKEKNSFLKKLRYHYRILIINEDTYENKFSFKLNKLKIFVWTSLFALALIIGTTFLIAFTPIKTYIPGYTAPGIRKDVIRLKLIKDSLENKLKLQVYKSEQFRKVLNNEITFDEYDKRVSSKKINIDTLELSPNKADSLLRIEVAQREKYNINTKQNSIAYNLMTPVKGEITNNFDIKKEHFAIDIALNNDTPIKSVKNGTVIFSDWSTNAGNTIIIEHPDHIISVYKHNHKLLRKTGDRVSQGEVVALSGNSGKQTSGPHLHFELWIKGYPVNPTDFINFSK